MLNRIVTHGWGFANQSNPNLRRPDSWGTLGVISLARLALNSQFRIVYPFLPAISRGLGVPLETASFLLTARSLVGTSSLLWGTLSDRYGRRAFMMLGLAALVLGSVLAGSVPSFGVALVAFAVLGLGKASYDPAMQAYIGDTVPYERRGRVLGILELPWALSWMIGVPAAGFLIARSGWRAPFAVIAALGLLTLLPTWRLRPDEHGRSGREPGPLRELGETEGMRPARRGIRVAAMTLAVTFLLMLANENVSVVYGAWLEGQFGLSVRALGVASTVVALAELLAEGTSAGLVDRLGKRRAVLTGLVLNLCAYLLLPQAAGLLIAPRAAGLGRSALCSALTGVFFLYLTFEFSIISLIPLVSELAPEARGTVMALNVAAMSVGRLLGSLSAPRLWAAGGLLLNAGASAVVMALACLILWRGVREAGSSPRIT